MVTGPLTVGGGLHSALGYIHPAHYTLPGSTYDLSPVIDLPWERPMTLPWDRPITVQAGELGQTHKRMDGQTDATNYIISLALRSIIIGLNSYNVCFLSPLLSFLCLPAYLPACLPARGLTRPDGLNRFNLPACLPVCLS